MFDRVRQVPSVSSDVSIEDKKQQAAKWNTLFNFSELTDFSGPDISGNIWDNAGTQLN